MILREQKFSIDCKVKRMKYISLQLLRRNVTFSFSISISNHNYFLRVANKYLHELKTRKFFLLSCLGGTYLVQLTATQRNNFVSKFIQALKLILPISVSDNVSSSVMK